jgi:hypothetical protein
VCGFRETVPSFRDAIPRFHEITSGFREMMFLFREIMSRFREVISRFREIASRFRGDPPCFCNLRSSQPYCISKPRLSLGPLLQRLPVRASSMSGITVGKRTAIADALKAYKQVQIDQSTEQSSATGARTQGNPKNRSKAPAPCALCVLCG